MEALKPSTGPDWLRSSALPCGTPSMMSNRMTSPSSLSRDQMRQSAADLSRTDQSDLLARHPRTPVWLMLEIARPY